MTQTTGVRWHTKRWINPHATSFFHLVVYVGRKTTTAVVDPVTALVATDGGISLLDYNCTYSTWVLDETWIHLNIQGPQSIRDRGTCPSKVWSGRDWQKCSQKMKR